MCVWVDGFGCVCLTERVIKRDREIGIFNILFSQVSFWSAPPIWRFVESGYWIRSNATFFYFGNKCSSSKKKEKSKKIISGGKRHHVEPHSTFLSSCCNCLILLWLGGWQQLPMTPFLFLCCVSIYCPEVDSLKNKDPELHRQVVKARSLKDISKIFLPNYAPYLLWPVFAITELYFL